MAKKKAKRATKKKAAKKAPAKKRTAKKKTKPDGDPQEKRRRYNRKTRLGIQDISGNLPSKPKGADLKDRKLCDSSLRHHLVTCYPDAFRLAFSRDHLDLIDHLERIFTRGGLRAVATPRGTGKTTIFMRSALWAILSLRRRFVCVVAATKDAAVDLLEGLKNEIMANPILRKLYGRELHALWSLHGEARQASGQKFKGALTGVKWKEKKIGFGRIPGVASSESLISVCGLTGNVRGQQETTTRWGVIRPDVVLCDDPQTKQSANSPAQCKDRHEIMMGDVLGLAGPDAPPISGLCACTVIVKNDLADRLLDRERSPDWQGQRNAMVYKWPDREELWDEYRAIRDDELRSDGDGSRAAQFVRDNYDDLHRGADVAWPERFNADEVSALQHAYNLRFRDETTFWAEYQNDPSGISADAPFQLEPTVLMVRCINVGRRQIPSKAEKLTAFVDVQGNVLYFMVTAWEICGRGYVVDYGTYPKQPRTYYSKSKIVKTLQEDAGTDEENAAIYAGLANLLDPMFSTRWAKTDGGVMRLDRAGIDIGWERAADTIRRYCLETENFGRVHPVRGKGIGVNDRPWSEYHHTKKDRLGTHCKSKANADGIEEIMVDTNWWKSWAAERLGCPIGSDRAVVLFKAKPHIHQMVAEHWTSEHPVMRVGRAGNEMVEWIEPQTHLDNEFWDTLVGTCVLGHIEGVAVDGPRPGLAVEANVRVQRRGRKKRRGNFVGW